MKILIGLIIAAAVGLGIWGLWAANNSANNESTALNSSTGLTNSTDYSVPTPTSDIMVTATPMATETPVPVPPPQSTPSPVPQPVYAPVFVSMNPWSSATIDEYGTAALTADSNGMAVISFDMAGEPIGFSQPAYIVNGTCSSIGNVVYALAPVMNNGSTTTLNTSFLSLAQSQSKLAIVIYMPGSQNGACGQLN